VTHGKHVTGQAAFARSAFARLRASTGQRLHRDSDRQHFFLTLPAFISLRTVFAGDLFCFFLPNAHSIRLRNDLG
jgi:hypothetical protein